MMSETRTPLEDHCAGIALLQRKAAHFDALRSALRTAIPAHANLYKSTFGEKADPMQDCVYRDMVSTLAAADEIGGNND
jgi:DNA-binding FadR family transcriptional regulator